MSKKEAKKNVVESSDDPSSEDISSEEEKQVTKTKSPQAKSPQVKSPQVKSPQVKSPSQQRQQVASPKKAPAKEENHTSEGSSTSDEEVAPPKQNEKKQVAQSPVKRPSAELKKKEETAPPQQQQSKKPTPKKIETSEESQESSEEEVAKKAPPKKQQQQPPQQQQQQSGSAKQPATPKPPSSNNQKNVTKRAETEESEEEESEEGSSTEEEESEEEEEVARPKKATTVGSPKPNSNAHSSSPKVGTGVLKNNLKKTSSGSVVYSHPVGPEATSSDDEEITEKNLVKVVIRQQKKLRQLNLKNKGLQNEVYVLQKLIEGTTSAEEIVKSGTVEKKDPIGGKWEDKFVSITKTGFLKIYNKEGDKIPVDLIELSRSTIYAQVEKNSKPKPLFFNIRSEDKRDYLFRSEDKIKKGEWIQVLRDTAKQVKSPRTPSPQKNQSASSPDLLRKTQSEIMNNNNKEAPKRRKSWFKKQ